MIRKIFTLFLVFGLTACSSLPVIPEQKVLGRWNFIGVEAKDGGILSPQRTIDSYGRYARNKQSAADMAFLNRFVVFPDEGIQVLFNPPTILEFKANQAMSVQQGASFKLEQKWHLEPGTLIEKRTGPGGETVIEESHLKLEKGACTCAPKIQPKIGWKHGWCLNASEASCPSLHAESCALN